MSCQVAYVTRTPTPCRFRFDGRPDPCHWIPQQRIKREQTARGWSDAELERILKDPRNIADGCRRHHDALDGRASEKERILMEEHDYPASVPEFAAEIGFHFHSPTRGWVADPQPRRRAR